MKKLIKLTALSTIILSFTAAAIAGESISIKVSCVIPAIPGVNAPPYTSEEIRQVQEGQKITRESKEKGSKKAYQRIKEEMKEVAYITEEEIMPQDNSNIESSSLAADSYVKRTVYSR